MQNKIKIIIPKKAENTVFPVWNKIFHSGNLFFIVRYLHAISSTCTFFLVVVRLCSIFIIFIIRR